MTEISESLVRRALVLLVAAKVAGLVLLFDPASATPFEGPKSIFSLAIGSVMAALIVVLVLESGVRSLLRSRIHFAVALFALANIVAVLIAQDQYVALFGAQRRLGLAFVLDMVVLYLAVALAYRSTPDWAALAAAVGLAGALAIAYGLSQSAGLDPIRWADDVRARPPSTFGNPDKFGHFLGATLAAAVALAVLPAHERPRGVRVLAGLYAGAALVMAAIVATRGTILGLAAALPLIGLLYLVLSRGRARVRTVLVGSAGAVGLLSLAAAVAMATPLGDRVRGGFADVASQQRLILIDTAIRAFADRPISGHGPDNFGVIYPRYRPDTASPLVGQDSAHSWPLQALATTGLFGTLSLTAVVIASLAALWRGAVARVGAADALLAGGVAYWAHGLVAFGSVSIDWLGWVAAGGAAALAVREEPAAQRRVVPFLQAAVLAAGVAIALSGYAALQAGREAYAARAARSPERAVQAASRAVELDPGRAEYWFALGLAHRQRGALAEAARGFRGAAERAPYVSAYWSNLAVTLADVVNRGDQSLGGRGAALDAARRGVDADRLSSRPHLILAVVSNALGDPAAALEAVSTAIELNVSDAEYDTVAADAASRMTDAAAARAALERIVKSKDSAVLRVALAQTSVKLNDAESARTHVRRALDLDPQNAAAGVLLRQLGP